MIYSVVNKHWKTPAADHIEFDDSSLEVKVKTTPDNQQSYSGQSEIMFLKTEAKN